MQPFLDHSTPCLWMPRILKHDAIQYGLNLIRSIMRIHIDIDIDIEVG